MDKPSSVQIKNEKIDDFIKASSEQTNTSEKLKSVEEEEFERIFIEEEKLDIKEEDIYEDKLGYFNNDLQIKTNVPQQEQSQNEQVKQLKIPKSNAQLQRECRQRKKEGISKKIPKSNAQYIREWRQRKKEKLLQKIREERISQKIPEGINKKIPEEGISQKIPEGINKNISEEGISQKIPKSNAQCLREYRQRKKGVKPPTELERIQNIERCKKYRARLRLRHFNNLTTTEKNNLELKQLIKEEDAIKEIKIIVSKTSSNEDLQREKLSLVKGQDVNKEKKNVLKASSNEDSQSNSGKCLDDSTITKENDSQFYYINLVLLQEDYKIDDA